MLKDFIFGAGIIGKCIQMGLVFTYLYTATGFKIGAGIIGTT
jgi:hypothetical protein